MSLQTGNGLGMIRCCDRLVLSPAPTGAMTEGHGFGFGFVQREVFPVKDCCGEDCWTFNRAL